MDKVANKMPSLNFLDITGYITDNNNNNFSYVQPRKYPSTAKPFPSLKQVNTNYYGMKYNKKIKKNKIKQKIKDKN